MSLYNIMLRKICNSGYLKEIKNKYAINMSKPAMHKYTDVPPASPSTYSIPKHDNSRPLRVQLSQQRPTILQRQRPINHQTHTPSQNLHIPLLDTWIDMRHANNTIQKLAYLFMLPLGIVHARLRLHGSNHLHLHLSHGLLHCLACAHLGQCPRRPGADRGARVYGDDERRTAVEEMEGDGAATGAAGLAPDAAIGGDAGKDDEHAVGADVGLRICVAESECVGGLGEELVG